MRGSAVAGVIGGCGLLIVLTLFGVEGITIEQSILCGCAVIGILICLSQVEK